MVAKWLASVLIVLAVILGIAYYLLYRPQTERLDKTLGEAAACAEENHRLRSELADLLTVRDQLKGASAQLQAQIATKQREMDALRSTHDELIGELQQEIADKQIEVERVRDKLRVEMVDEVLFDSGEAALKPEGVAILRKIGDVLARAQRGIEIQGHTDNVPITGALAHRFATNWELSAARALNVARFLQDEAKVAPERLSAAAYSEYHPRDLNDTEEGRRRNRRIEILLVPLEIQADTAPAAEAPSAEGVEASPTASPTPSAEAKSPEPIA